LDVSLYLRDFECLELLVLLHLSLSQIKVFTEHDSVFLLLNNCFRFDLVVGNLLYFMDTLVHLEALDVHGNLSSRWVGHLFFLGLRYNL